MNVKFLVFGLLYSLVFNSCNKNQHKSYIYNSKDKLFYIKNYKDFQYMANSTNVKKLDKKTSLFLTTSEKEFDDLNIEYKNFGEIFKNEKFKAIIIFSEVIEPELLQNFIVRTFDLENNIIDSYSLCSYSFDSGEFWKGSINKNLIIEKYSDTYSFTMKEKKKKITNFGEIIDLKTE